MELTNISARILFSDVNNNDLVVCYDITDLEELGFPPGRFLEVGWSFQHDLVEYAIAEISFFHHQLTYPSRNMPSGCVEISPSKGYNLDIRIIVTQI